MLLFDEMKIRKSLYVNPNTLKFDGVANTNMNDSEFTNDQADYALVCVFSSVHAQSAQTLV